MKLSDGSRYSGDLDHFRVGPLFKRTSDKTLSRIARTPADVGHRVLNFLASQDLSPTPQNYELVYLRTTDRQSLAARAIDAIVMSGAKVTTAQADHIWAAYKAATVGKDQEDPDRVRLRHQALGLVELTASAAAATDRFERDLTSELAGLGSDDHPLATVISGMVERARATESLLAAASAKIEALRQEVAAARTDAQIDALTGLTNRRGLETEIRQATNRLSGAVAICDIDRFKSINDRYGHPVGDRVLKAVATAINETCSPHMVTRWGGEEFVVVMHDVKLNKAAEVIAAANAALATKTFRVRETDESVGVITFSAGVVSIDARGVEAAIGKADTLLYKAKREGRNRIISE